MVISCHSRAARAFFDGTGRETCLFSRTANLKGADFHRPALPIPIRDPATISASGIRDARSIQI